MVNRVAGRVWRCVVAAFAVVAAVLSVLVAPQAARAAGTEVSSWADAVTALKGSADPVTYTVSSDQTPGDTLTVPAGRTLIVKGSGTLTGGTSGASLFRVEKDGTLVLDQVTISGNTVGDQGAVNVAAGGKLELGFADGQGATAPSITGNVATAGGAARNLVGEKSAKVRLNAAPDKPIGLSYAGTVEAPVSLVESGRYAVQAGDVEEGKITADDTTLKTVLANGRVLVRSATPKVLYWAPDASHGGNSLTMCRGAGYTDLTKNWLYGYADITMIYGTSSVRKTFVNDAALKGGSLDQFDFIYIEPSVMTASGTSRYTDEEINALLSFLDSGGRIFIQCENNKDYTKINAGGTELAQRLNTGFQVETDPKIAAGQNTVTTWRDSTVSSFLTDGLPDQWSVYNASPITYDPSKANAIFTALRTGDTVEYAICVDMQAGSSSDVTPYGNITVISDGNIWAGAWSSAGNSSTNPTYLGYTESFAKNLLAASVDSRNIAATGVNPNERFVVTFDSQNGSSVPSQTVLKDGKVSKPDNPTREGYDFAKWTTDKAGENEYDFGSAVTADMTLYAQWTPHTYKVMFDPNAEDVEQEAYSQDFSYGTAQELTANKFTRPGYEFLIGWNTDKDGNGTMYADGQAVSDLTAEDNGTFTLYAQWSAVAVKYTVEHYLQDASNSSSYVKDDSATQTLYGLTGKQTIAAAKAYDGFAAKAITQQSIAGAGTTVVQVRYDRKSYALSFDGNGHRAAIMPTDQNVKFGAKASKPDDLTGVTGYTFDGWYRDQNCTQKWDFNENTMPASDLTLYAKWTGIPADYTVEHYLQNLDDDEYTLQSGDTETKSGTTGEDTAAEAKTTYAGFTAKDFSQKKIAADGKTVVRIYYTRDRYKLSFDANGAEGATLPADMEFKYEAKLSAPTTEPSVSGYAFVDWYQEAACENVFDFTGTMPAGGVTAYAKWTANTDTAYKVEHYLQNLADDGYALKATDDKTGATGDRTDAAAKSYTGFTAGDVAQAEIAGDGSTVVRIYYARNTHDVTFDARGHGATPAKLTGVRYGAQVADPGVLSAEGYVFGGWYADKACTKVWDFAVDVMPDGDVTLYAKWGPASDTRYVVEHFRQNLDGSYGAEPDVTQTLTGVTGADTAAVARSYEGFTVEPFAQRKIAGDGSTVVVIRYARNAYTVLFDANGHGVAPSVRSGVLYGALLDNPGALSADGWSFGGWYADEACSTAWDFAVDTMPANDVTLYAKWTVNEYAITYDAAGGALPADAPRKHTYGTEVKLPAATRDGYTFAGWYDEAGNKIDVVPADAKDVKVTARWIKQSDGQDKDQDQDQDGGNTADGGTAGNGNTADNGKSGTAANTAAANTDGNAGALASTGATALAAGLTALALAAAGVTVAVLRRRRSR